MATSHTDPLSWTNWHADPSILIGTVILTLAYVIRARMLDRRGLGPSTTQRLLFVGAVASVLLALTSPLHDLSDTYLFSAHMIQHLMLIMVMPPLLLASLSPEMVRPLVHLPGVEPVLRFVTRPLIAFSLCNVIFAASHLPQLYDLTLRDHGVHIAEHLVFMVTAVILWWPILSPLPEIPRLGYAAQLFYVFIQVLPGSLIGGLISNTDRVLYPYYAAAPRIFGLTPVQDQQLGAIVMWVGGGTFYLIAFTVIFFVWAYGDMREMRQNAPTYSRAASDHVSRP